MTRSAQPGRGGVLGRRIRDDSVVVVGGVRTGYATPFLPASTIEIDAGHLSLITHPDQVANLILRAARATKETAGEVDPHIRHLTRLAFACSWCFEPDWRLPVPVYDAIPLLTRCRVELSPLS